MTKLPPVEKLPLAVRKNVRDDWEAKKDDLAKDVSEVLGTAWTVDVDLPQIYAYAKDGWAKESLGSCVAEHIRVNTRRLRDFVESYDAETLKDLNTLCYAHVLTLDVDEEGRFDCGGADVLDGKLRILFEPASLSRNIGDAFNRKVLLQALNDAPAPSGAEQPLSVVARYAKRTEYDNSIDEVRNNIGKILGKPDITLTPNFEDTFAKIQAEAQAPGSSIKKEYWEEQVPSFIYLYFAGFQRELERQGFDKDEMLQEGFNEAVDKGEIAFRIVDELKGSNSCEFAIEGGVFYLQCTVKTWGSNIDDAARNIVDQL